MSPSWKDARLLAGKARQTCYCVDAPKWKRCTTCPWFEWGVERAERWVAAQATRDAA